MAMNNRYRITVDGVAYEVEVGDIEMSPVEVTVNGIGYTVEVPDLQRVDPTVATPPRPAARPAPRRPAERARPSPTAANDSQNVVRAPMPGRIVRVNVCGRRQRKPGRSDRSRSRIDEDGKHHRGTSRRSDFPSARRR